MWLEPLESARDLVPEMFESGVNSPRKHTTVIGLDFALVLRWTPSRPR
jgi:hypothetical protein